MRIRSFFLWVSDQIWFKIIGGNHLKSLYKKRCTEICSIVTSMFPEDEPYVFDGKWSWYKDSYGIHYPITLVFLEKNLVIQAQGPEIGLWELQKKFSRNKETWAKSNNLDSHLSLICEESNLDLIKIGWNDPIDYESLYLKISQFIQE